MQNASVCIKAVCVHNLFNGVLGKCGGMFWEQKATLNWHVYSGGSWGVLWVTWNPPFCRFARVHRQPRAHARAQSKTFWMAMAQYTLSLSYIYTHAPLLVVSTVVPSDFYFPYCEGLIIKFPRLLNYIAKSAPPLLHFYFSCLSWVYSGLIQMFHRLFERPDSKLNPVELQLKYHSPDSEQWWVLHHTHTHTHTHTIIYTYNTHDPRRCTHTQYTHARMRWRR